MGNYRFRLSDMMPNAWFYKLKDMRQRANKNHSTARGGKSTRGGAPPPATAAATVTSKPVPPPHSRLVPNRASSYYSSRAEAETFSFSPTHCNALDTHLPVDPPRKSKKKSRNKPAVKPKSVASTDPDISTIIKQLSAVSSGCRCRAWKPEFTPVFPPAVASPEAPTPTGQRDYYIDNEDLQFQCDDRASWPHSCSRRVTSSATEVIIDVDRKSSTDELHSLSKLKLPPILTKPESRDAEATQFEDKNVDSNHSFKNQSRKSSPGLHRLRMRANSPRLASKKVQAHRGKRLTWAPPPMQQRKGGLSASFAVVKASSDPQRDFRDSMMEMIVANNITASKDLEELLACYLSLNSNEYHDVIVKVFQQIWFDLTANIKL